MIIVRSMISILTCQMFSISGKLRSAKPNIIMSNDVVIKAEGLGKKYIIGHQSAERVPTLRDAISRTVSSFARGAGDMLRGRAIVGGDDLEEFWALKDVSFDIKRGDVVGIIGRNGAGKSTLLKVLSRITEPTVGRVEIKGRVASLLEVGTGFHPELSGRENIFLNGAILGMSRAEIIRKFDEIVDFSGVEKFLDTPVKRYSSGMYVRLAFAVAAHLEPEILVVDEVLAVGDAEFQTKCLGKMQDVAGQGRTVLFVSHNMGAIRTLCPTSLLLRSGTKDAYGPTNIVMQKYADRGSNLSDNQPILRVSDAIVSVQNKVNVIENTIGFEFSFKIKTPLAVAINVEVSDNLQNPFLVASTGGYGSQPLQIDGNVTKTFKFSPIHLATGTYSANIEIIDLIGGSSARLKEDINFEWESIPMPGNTITLKQEWGVGSIHIPLLEAA